MSSDNGYATRDELLSPGKRRFKDVVLPIRDVKLRIRSLMENESELFQSEMFSRGKVQTGKTVSSYRRLIVLCVCDGLNDSPLFGPNDMESLNNWDGADIIYLGKECESFCGFVDGEVEKMEKNFETATAVN